MKLSTREMENENERSSPLGFFNVADSYWASGRFLIYHRLDVSHQDNVVRFLLYHSIECFLKAFLRSKGISIHDLANPKKFGHKVSKLSVRARRLGLQFDDKDEEIFKLMSISDTVIRARYFKRGCFF